MRRRRALPPTRSPGGKPRPPLVMTIKFPGMASDSAINKSVQLKSEEEQKVLSVMLSKTRLIIARFFLMTVDD